MLSTKGRSKAKSAATVAGSKLCVRKNEICLNFGQWSRWLLFSRNAVFEPLVSSEPIGLLWALGTRKVVGFTGSRFGDAVCGAKFYSHQSNA